MELGKYKEAVEEFLGKYEKPVVENVTVGFSGIDPQRKYLDTDIDDHELLINLQGGDETGHYHLTQEQIKWLIDQMSEKYKPNISIDQEIHITADEDMDDFIIDSDNTGTRNKGNNH